MIRIRSGTNRNDAPRPEQRREDDVPRSFSKHQASTKKVPLRWLRTVTMIGTFVFQITLLYSGSWYRSRFGVRLRLDWTHLPPVTPLARRIEESQTKCFRQNLGAQETYHFEMLQSGMGSTIHTWSQALCHAVEYDHVLVTEGMWGWNDDSLCAKTVGENGPLACFFGHHTYRSHSCPKDTLREPKQNTTRLGSPLKFAPCHGLVKNYGLPAIRAATTEWLFQNVTEIVIEEAKRQIQELFPSRMPKAKDLITVHMRWSDKGSETPLTPAADYVNYTKLLLTPEELSGSQATHILLITEDPKALAAYQAVAPDSWRVYAPGPKLMAKTILSLIRTRAGLESMASLLVSLEANRYLLGSGSNWSRLINELRKNVLDPRCGYCTKMINIHELIYNETDYGET